ncbi:acetyl-CoA C-acetyltransferase [Pseudomonas sp. JM0905a]|uniref:acetyl-CoA C-acetyltransferase n=1 Tax=Pseudomonas sp. JM0905a TaxID=2772484 RepID=UPI0016820A94|nr:acetyl-CoA C-acetyltransferase [Pseudomonas sp. JM0905a]MBD2835545.1 acetyl-CoA C-acetyltransferase [Pseudomonas sp. JM0905a]
MTDVVIVAAVRTPIGRFGGVLSQVPATALGAVVLRALLDRTRVPAEDVDEVIMGQVLTAAAGQNPARQSAVAAGLPFTVPAFTLNKVCGSGLKAVHLAVQSIRSGDAEVVLAGGQENMSVAPYLLDRARQGLRMGHGELLDSMIHDGLWDTFNDYHMGMTAENLAEQYGITREQQDAYALSSHRRAANARLAGRFEAEVVPVAVPGRKGESRTLVEDELPAIEPTLEGLSRLRPAFHKDGSVTAGNASPLNDGAAAVMIMSADRARAYGLPVLVTVRAFASVGVEPSVMGIGPVFATDLCLQKAGWHLDQLDLVETNEAFAVQTLAVGRELGWDTGKVNVNGGAIALGHPLGASGCRILVSLLHEMNRRDARRGLATLCIGGGQGVALALERD